jgi:hypothetical protein
MSANPPSQQRTEIVTCIRDAVMAPSEGGRRQDGRGAMASGGCSALPAKSRALLGAHAGTPGLTMVNAVGSARLPKNEKGAPLSGKDAPLMPPRPLVRGRGIWPIAEVGLRLVVPQPQG